MRSSDLEEVTQPSPEMTSQRRSVDHFGLRGSGSDSKLSGITASPATVSQYAFIGLCITAPVQCKIPCTFYAYYHVKYIVYIFVSRLDCVFFLVQVHRLRSSRSSGSSGFGFSSHSHAKFVSQLMRESRLRVSTVIYSVHIHIHAFNFVCIQLVCG